MIKKFNKEKNLGLKITYNSTAESDRRGHRGWTRGLDTVKIGLRGLDDDVLLIFGDAILCEKGVRKVIEHPKRCISGYQIYKIPRELLPKLRNLNKIGLMYPLHEFCMANNGIKMWGINDADVDLYSQTEEGRGIKKTSIDLNVKSSISKKSIKNPPTKKRETKYKKGDKKSCRENFRPCIHCSQCNHVSSSTCKKCGRHPKK